MQLLVIQICAIDSKQCLPRNACKVIVQVLQVYHPGQSLRDTAEERRSRVSAPGAASGGPA